MIEQVEADSPEVQRFLAELRALPETTEPTPSAELAALLSGVTPLEPVRARRRTTGWMVAAIAAVALVVAAAGTGFAAAANALPGPLQDAMADLSDHHYLPFNVPHSTDGEPGGVPGFEKNGLPAEMPAQRGTRPRVGVPEGSPSNPPEDQDPLEGETTAGPSEDPEPSAAPTPSETPHPEPAPTGEPSTEPQPSENPAEDEADDQQADETEAPAQDQGRNDDAPAVGRGKVKADPPGLGR